MVAITLSRRSKGGTPFGPGYEPHVHNSRAGFGSARRSNDGLKGMPEESFGGTPKPIQERLINFGVKHGKSPR